MAAINRHFCVLAAGVLLHAAETLADQELISVKADHAPVIDGRADDPVWSRAPAVTTIDAVAKIPLTLKSVHTDAEIFLLVTYPDATENREHKTMLWDPATEMYRTGPKREDVFVVKWNMEPFAADLTLSAEKPYRADIWFWKAYRTDHAGYADDKMQIYSVSLLARAQKLFARTGQAFYLVRPGDDGEAAYRPRVHHKYEGDSAPRYIQAQPSGSRADVRAKGIWQPETWTVEFSRRLDTTHSDDIQFDRSLAYRFGVSRYEIAGREPDPSLEQPHYGSGEIGEHLTLIFR